MKRIIFCFDGTWNKIDSRDPTNVARVAQSISPRDGSGRTQLIYYDEGVGTGYRAGWVAKWWEKIKGGVLGEGLDQNLIEAYHFLVLNYEPGDELVLFGFSRGAFTARSFAGMIRNCGIMSRRSLEHIGAAVRFYFSRAPGESPKSDKASQFRFDHCPGLCLPGDEEWRKDKHGWSRPAEAADLRVRYLGVWDTVGQLGVPGTITSRPLFNRRHQFHDTELSRFVESARHAVAADEVRPTYSPTLWSNLETLNGDERPPRFEQRVFPGNHCGVGGGGPVRGLSDAALDWVLEGAISQDLAVDGDACAPIRQVRPDHRAQVFNRRGGMGPSAFDWLKGMGRLGPRDLRALEITRANGREEERLVDVIGIDQVASILVRRFAAPAVELAERAPYRPRALEKLWGAIAARAEVEHAPLEAGDPLWDERILRAPDKVSCYLVAAGDTLSRIAERQMGGADDSKILFLHNRNAGRLFDPAKLYVGTEIEIPHYAAPPQTS